MARPCLVIVLTLALLLAACGVNGRMYPPQYEQPQSRLEAATMLNAALMQGVDAMANVSATETELRWEEILPPLSMVEPSPRVTLKRSLLFSQLSAVSHPTELDGNWIMRLTSAGGDVTLVFNNADAAARAEAAFKRLGAE